MRLFFLGILILGFEGDAAAQCPVLPRHASVDPSGKSVSIRYYNSGNRAVQAVDFTLKGLQVGQNEPAVIARYAARLTLHPKVEQTAVFRRPAGELDLNEIAEVEALELQVTRVVFADRSTWTPSHENPCKVSISHR